jgi:hypothetical protein
VPGRSTTKVGCTPPAPFSTAVLPAGRDTKAHAKVSESPSTSLDAPPFKVTVCVTSAV